MKRITLDPGTASPGGDFDEVIDEGLDVGIDGIILLHLILLVLEESTQLDPSQKICSLTGEPCRFGCFD